MISAAFLTSMAFHVRSATQEHYSAFAALWPTLDDPNPPPLMERWESEMMPTSFVAEQDDSKKVVGYTWWSAAGSEGQVKYIMVDANYRRRGVATALLDAVARELKGRGCRRWRLHVRPENQAAVALYQKFGLQRCFGAAEVHLTWDILSKLPSENVPSKCRLVTPDEEAVIESSLVGLFPGVFLEARELGSRIPLQLRRSDTNELLGCCIFDPAFPGAYPFVCRPAQAKNLLDEMEKSRDGQRDDFFLLIENQAALVDALVAAGGKIKVNMDCYTGSL